MARLPQPGGDAGNWGDVLNDFLEQAHEQTGELKPIAQSKVTNLTSVLASKAASSDFDALNNRIINTENALNSLDSNVAASINNSESETRSSLDLALANFTKSSAISARADSGLRVGTLAVLSDSITTYDQANNIVKVTRNWLGFLAVNSRQRVRHGGIYGTGGFRLDQIRDVHLPQVLAASPRPAACVIAGGTNDASAQSAGWTALLQIITALEDAGIRPVLWLIPPRSDSALGTVSAWNAKVQTLARSRGYQVVDGYSPLVSPTTGAWKNTSLVQQSDAIHPSGEGHAAIAAALLVQSSWVNSFDASPPYLTAGPGDTINLAPSNYGLFAGDSNADGLANGWLSYGTANFTPSLVIDNDGYTWQRLARAEGVLGQGGIQLDITTGFSPGDVIAMTMQVRTSSPGHAISATLSALEGTGSPVNIGYGWDAAAAGGIIDGVLFGRGIVPPLKNRLRITLAHSPLTTSLPAYYVEFSRVTVLNLTAMGLA